MVVSQFAFLTTETLSSQRNTENNLRVSQCSFVPLWLLLPEFIIETDTLSKIEINIGKSTE